MKLFKNQKNQLVPIEKDSFKLEKEIQELVENNLDNLFGLEFVSTEFRVGEFRIDTLAFDESTNSFVIIEYKKGSSYSVVDQGYSYLSTMINNKAEFVLEYSEKKGGMLKRDSVDWSSSKVVFVSPAFTVYQRNSVNFGDIPFELWEIRKFESGYIALDRLESSSSESIEKIAVKKENSVIKKVNSEVKIMTMDDHEKELNSDLSSLWISIKSRLGKLEGGDFYTKKHYIAFSKDGTRVCSIKFRKKRISIEFVRGNIKQDGSKTKGFFTFDDPKKRAKVIQQKHVDGRRFYYELFLSNSNELDYIMFLVEQKFNTL